MENKAETVTVPRAYVTGLESMIVVMAHHLNAHIDELQKCSMKMQQDFAFMSAAMAASMRNVPGGLETDQLVSTPDERDHFLQIEVGGLIEEQQNGE